MKCSSCNEAIDEDSKFCEHCGQKVDKDHQQKAAHSDRLLPFREHLEFLGYEITSDNEEGNRFKLIAVHSSKPNLLISCADTLEVLVFISPFELKKKVAVKDRARLLELLNTFNSSSVITTFLLSEEGGVLSTSFVYTGAYDKKNFSKIIELYEQEISGHFAVKEFQEFVN